MSLKSPKEETETSSTYWMQELQKIQPSKDNPSNGSPENAGFKLIEHIKVITSS